MFNSFTPPSNSRYVLRSHSKAVLSYGNFKIYCAGKKPWCPSNRFLCHMWAPGQHKRPSCFEIKFRSFLTWTKLKVSRKKIDHETTLIFSGTLKCFNYIWINNRLNKKFESIQIPRRTRYGFMFLFWSMGYSK